MRETTVARNYAEALLELARDDDAIDAYAAAIRQIAELMRTERQLRRFLDTPRVEADEKRAVVRDVFEGRVPDRFLRFLFVVIDKRRQRILPVIADQFADLVNELYGRIEVSVTMAVEPDNELRRALKERLAGVFEKEIFPTYHLDPRILGGVIIRVGDRVMDGSLRRRLQGLRRSLLRTELPRIEFAAAASIEEGGEQQSENDESRAE
jgi:F-type H+-transporting ATPase subunit delta